MTSIRIGQLNHFLDNGTNCYTESDIHYEVCPHKHLTITTDQTINFNNTSVYEIAYKQTAFSNTTLMWGDLTGFKDEYIDILSIKEVSNLCILKVHQIKYLGQHSPSGVHKYSSKEYGSNNSFNFRFSVKNKISNLRTLNDTFQIYYYPFGAKTSDEIIGSIIKSSNSKDVPFGKLHHIVPF